MLTDAQLIAKYGNPGDPTHLAILTLPYPMRIAWDVTKTVTKIQCHKLILAALRDVFTDLLAHYGIDELKRLEIDLYGGCVNVRKMRGSKTKWSRHAWGVAIDLSPSKNALKTKKPQAQFSAAVYQPMIDIFYQHGFFSLGREEDRDWMHFEINT